MQLSVAIPVYNFYVRELCEEIRAQALQAGLQFEIILGDDASEEDFAQTNRKLQEYPELVYFRSEKNIGRAAIRNVLGREAKGEYVIFLDADSKIREGYIKTYWKNRLEGVLIGGTLYPEKLPDPKVALHYHYGSKIEAKGVAQRSRLPYSHFHSNNFMLPRKLFNSLGFNESLQQYGHEDTLFGLKLQSEKIALKHIDNPVLHTGLVTNPDFLEKSRKAVENLHLIYRSKLVSPKRIKALRYLRRSVKLGVLNFIAMRFSQKRSKWEKQLVEFPPNLRLFQIYKLGYLCFLHREFRKQS